MGPARWAPPGGPPRPAAGACSLVFSAVRKAVASLSARGLSGGSAPVRSAGRAAPSWGCLSWALAGLVARGQRVCWPCVWRLSALRVPPPPTPFSWEGAEVIHSISQSSSLGSEKGRDVFEDLWPLQKRSDVEPGGLRAAAPHGAVREGPGVGELRTLDFLGQPRRNAEPEPAGPAATRAWSRALRSLVSGTEERCSGRGVGERAEGTAGQRVCTVSRVAPRDGRASCIGPAPSRMRSVAGRASGLGSSPPPPPESRRAAA